MTSAGPRALSPFDLPRSEARAVFARGVPVFVPVNPTEYHGPHLSLRNDALVSQGLARDLARDLAPDGPLLVVPDLEVGVDPCPGPGTVATSLARVELLVDEACRALCELGATRLVLLTFHGAPLHALALSRGVARAATFGARAVAPLSAAQRHLMGLWRDAQAPHSARADEASSFFAAVVRHVDDADTRARLVRGIPLDFHAGFVETSMALHYAPSSVRGIYKDLPPCPEITPDRALAAAARLAARLGQAELALELELSALGRGWYAMRPFFGYTGTPAEADARAGAVLADMLVEFMLALCRRVFSGAEHPTPMMPWLRTLTLGGRLPTHDVRPGDMRVG